MKKLVEFKNKHLHFNNTTLAVILVIGLILSLIPILYISHFSFPTADDFDYSILTHSAWLNTHSIFDMISASIKSSINMYNSWQGTFIAMIIMAFQPGVFGENLYFLCTYITVFIFILGNLFLGKVILMDYLKANKSTWLVVTIPVIIMSMQYLPSPVQAFFWWNGGFYYTGFYSIELILFGLILKYYKKNVDEKRWRLIIPIWILSAMVASSNFTTSPDVVMLLVIFTIAGFIINKKKGKYVLIGAILAAISLFISVTAPGNAVRQALTPGMGLVDAVVNSFVYAGRFIVNWTNTPTILVLIFISFVLLGLLKNTKWQFKYPILISIFTFGVFASLLTPPFFASRSTGADRLVNLLYYAYYWLMLINIFYYMGWMRNVISKYFKTKTEFTKAEEAVTKAFKQKAAIVCVVLLIIFIPSVLHQNFEKTTSYSAYQSLKNGEAEEYKRELNARLKLYNDKSVKNVVVDELTVRPYVLYFDDITTDVNDWRNRSAKVYYNKESVRLKTIDDINKQ